MFYFWSTAIFLILPISIESVPMCMDDDYDVIQSCYHDTLFSADDALKDSTNIRHEMISMFKDPEKLQNICQARDNLYDCVNAKGTHTYERCFNVNDFKGFQLGNYRDLSNARRYIANYFQLTYICNPKNKWALQNTECITRPIDNCEYLVLDDCEDADSYVLCASTVYKNCNEATSCYTQKIAIYFSCYEAFGCLPCDELSPSTNNIETWCFDDVNNQTTPSPSSTTTTIILPSTSNINFPPTRSTNDAHKNSILLGFFIFAIFFAHN